MSYAILRTAKLKSMGEIGGSLSHTFRTRETSNADPERLHRNKHLSGQSPDEVISKIKAKLPEKRRKDAVLCVEYFIGASPDFFQKDALLSSESDKYFKTALDWLKEKHGSENVVGCSIHRDETSPHMVAYVVPLDNQGKLNAKKYLGGRAKLSQMQTDFAKAVAHHGLKRGIEGSKAKHKSIKEYYSEVNKTEITRAPSVDVPEPKLSERVNTRAYGQRVAKDVLGQLEPAWRATRRKAERSEDYRKEISIIREGHEKLKKLLQPIWNAMEGLNMADRKTLAQYTVDLAKKLKAERKQERDRLIREKVERSRHKVKNRSMSR